MSIATPMDQMAISFRERFPLLTRFYVNSNIDCPITEALPPYFGIFLSIMANPPETPICFILPKLGDLPRLVSVLYSLDRFVKKWPQLIQIYVQANFTVGEKVRVHPGRHVYKYGGFNSEFPELLWLDLLDGSGRLTVRAGEFIPRLEKTTLTRPIGRLNTTFNHPPTPLERLLALPTCGNMGLFQNEVILLDSHTGFKEFVNTVGFQHGEEKTGFATLGEILPFGKLARPDPSNPFWIRKWDERNPVGGSIVAITHSDELLVDDCISAEARSQLVVVNGLSNISNIQAYDDFVRMQKTVLFAEREEEKMINALGQRGCRFWWVSNEEVNMGYQAPANHSSGIIGDVARWSYNYERLSIEAVSCECPELDRARMELEKLFGVVAYRDDSPLTKPVRRAWRILNEAASVVGRLDKHEIIRFVEMLALLRKEIQDNKQWLSLENLEALTNFANGIERVLSLSEKLGIDKGMAIQRFTLEEPVGYPKHIFIVRNENQAVVLKSWMRDHGLSGRAEVFSPNTLAKDGNFDRLICISWLGGDLMKQLASHLVTPQITVLAYPFERFWLKQFKNKMKGSLRVACITPVEKEKLLFDASGSTVQWPIEEVADNPIIIQSSDDVWAFEQKLRSVRKGNAANPTDEKDTIPAHFVSFVGESYAFISASHKVVIATEILSGLHRSNQGLPERLVTDIKPGDFVVFPASGDHEMLHEYADKLLGVEAAELRKTARLWQEVLNNAAIYPEYFQSKAKGLGRSRHIATIRSWFGNRSQIGPGDKDDLLLIALVTDSRELERKHEEVWNAIKRLKSAHLSAGMHLRDMLVDRLPEVIVRVEENGTEINLGELGSAWVVQADSIDPDKELRGLGEINRLLWE